MAGVEDGIETDIFEVSGDSFFQFLESQLKTSIPSYAKNILKMNGFCNAFMISKLNESKISQIEAFMRNDFEEFMIPETESMDDYLGVYKNSQNKFKFLCGHKTLLEIMANACRVYYPLTSTTAVTKPSTENIAEHSKDETFQKLFDGFTNWLKGQGKYEQVLQSELNFIINCEASSISSDDVSYSMKCPMPTCGVEKSFSVIWKSYARSNKNKNSDDATKFCQPRWYFCSLKNHFQKCHLDVVLDVDLSVENSSVSSLPTTHGNKPTTHGNNIPSTSGSASIEVLTIQSTPDGRISSVEANDVIMPQQHMDITEQIGDIIDIPPKISRARKTTNGSTKSIKNVNDGRAKRIRK